MKLSLVGRRKAVRVAEGDAQSGVVFVGPRIVGAN